LPTVEHARSMLWTRAALLATTCALALGAATLPARAALDMTLGAQKVVKNQPISSCNASAKSALTALFGDASEVGSGDTGEWSAYGFRDPSNHPAAAAAVHCYPLDNGYVVTFTCAVEAPPAPDTASALCTKLAAGFGGTP
jgi:hypothetical protein